MGVIHMNKINVNVLKKPEPEYDCDLFLGTSEQSAYKRDPNLDQKISLFRGDITKLEIDAIVNAGRSVCVSVSQRVFQLFSVLVTISSTSNKRGGRRNEPHFFQSEWKTFH